MRPRLLDLFCCAGGAGVGYARAGFDVVGVDLANQPRYPFEFHRGDALEYLREHGREFDAVHASPPCQHYSKAVAIEARKGHPDLVGPAREALRELGIPYVIENVVGAPLLDAFQLCGSSFGLPVRRHRRFEASFFVMVPTCRHEAFPPVFPPSWNRTTPMRVLSISGGYQRGITLEQYKAATGVDWDVTGRELSECIPPAFTEYIGGYLLNELVTAAAGVAA